MAFDLNLANRTRELLAASEKYVTEKVMFGGLCFMVNDKMAIGVEKDRLMVRIDPTIYETVMEKEGCRPMDFTGKVMKGFVFVDIDVLQTKKQLDYWVKLALAYNKIAKPGKKKSPVKKSAKGK